jgi:hypothetical protein
VADGEPVRLQRRLDRRAQDAGLDARGAAGRVHLEHAVEPAQVEADGAGVAVAHRRLDAAHDRGAAPEGDDGDLGAARPVEHGGHVGLARGQGDQVRRVGEVAAPGADRLRVGLAVGVQEALVGIVREQTGDRAGRRHHARRAQADVRRPRRRDDAGLFDAEAVGEEAEQPLSLGLVEARALHAPAVELQATVHGAILPRIRPERGR